MVGTQGIDLIAFNPYSQICLIVDCKTDAIDPNSLLTQIPKIKKEFPMIEPIPVIVTSKKIEETPEKENLDEKGVILIAKEQLNELFIITKAQRSLQEVEDYILNLKSTSKSNIITFR